MCSLDVQQRAVKGVEINKSSSNSIFQSLNRKHSLSVFSILFCLLSMNSFSTMERELPVWCHIEANMSFCNRNTF